MIYTDVTINTKLIRLNDQEKNYGYSNYETDFL